jgi:hypothetical protein
MYLAEFFMVMTPSDSPHLVGRVYWLESLLV